MFGLGREWGHSCSFCGKTFTEPGNLKVHIRDLHTNPQPWPCPVCQKVFKSKNSLANHRSLYHKDPSAMYSRYSNVLE